MKAILTLLAVPALALTSAAQDNPFPPPKELGSFAPMLGHWQGAGTVIPMPDMDPMDWTATSHVELIAGGHALRETTHVTLPGMPAMEFVVLYGWDREAKRNISMSVANQGAGSTNEAFWIDKNTLVSNRTGFEEGQAILERGITRFAGDKYTMEIGRAAGAGPFSTYVTGTFNRVKPEPGSKTIEASMNAGAPLANAGMKRAGKMVGQWKIAGKMIPAPGVPETAFSGVEHIEPVLGGNVLRGRIAGDKDPMGFEFDGLWYLSWNERDEAYDTFFVSNMGEFSHSQARFVGDDFVSATSLYQMGTPVANRMVLHMGEDGIKSAVAHAIIGSGEPMQVFHGEYTRVK